MSWELISRCFQIAISKFFDGEGPDPVEEARAALNSPPPRPARQTQNLMTDDIAAQFAPNPRAAEPAPRINTQPEDQSVYRPPFILALLFTPLNLLYRLLYSSFRLFGALFPFLPRFFNTTANPALQGPGEIPMVAGPWVPKIRPPVSSGNSRRNMAPTRSVSSRTDITWRWRKPTGTSNSS